MGEVSFLEPFSFPGKDSPASCRAGGVSVLLYWCLRASLGRGMGVSQLSLRPYLIPGFSAHAWTDSRLCYACSLAPQPLWVESLEETTSLWQGAALGGVVP